MLHFSFRHVRNVTVGNFNGESRSEIFLGQSGLTVKENLREKRLKKGKTISRAQKNTNFEISSTCNDIRGPVFDIVA